jgi:hypothetical protein
LLEQGLAADFDPLSLSNLLPAHRRCNLKKRSSTLEKGRLLFFLDIAEKATDKVMKLIESSSTIQKRDDAIARLASAIEGGILTVQIC